MADQDFIAKLFKNAEDLADERQAIYREQEGNRNLLRALKAEKGVLTPEQAKRVDELYPPRERKGKGARAPQTAAA